MLSQRLDWVQGQCALLAGYGIQGDVLANVLYKSGTLIMVPRTNLGLRLKYLYGELGCTAEVGAMLYLQRVPGGLPTQCTCSPRGCA